MSSTESSECKTMLNETVERVAWNTNIPSYLYKEIPGSFEMMGILLNVTMVIYFIKSKKYQSPLFTILTSLAIMDTFVCFAGLMRVFSLPTLIAPEVGFLCMVGGFTAAFGLMGSEYHLVLFASLRLYQVMSPLKARASVTVSLMVKLCAIIVALSLLSGISYGSHWRSLTTVIDAEQVTFCIFIGDNETKNMAYLFIQAVIPCVSIFLIHVLKYFLYIKSKSLVVSQQERKSPDARGLVIVIALFYISMVPQYIYLVVQQNTIENYKFSNDYLSMVFVHVMFSNSTMNPLVYVLAMKSIRDDVINFFCWKKKKTSN